MLTIRVIIGGSLIALLGALSWLDDWYALKGAILLPLGLVAVALATRELLRLLRGAKIQPLALPLYLGNLAVVAAAWLLSAVPLVAPAREGVAAAGPWIVLSVMILVLAVGEMSRYVKPGRTTIDLAAAVFGLVYLGGMMAAVVQLRMFWGVSALVSTIAVVKAGDAGAYIFGRLWGRHPMAPLLSPNKTIEGLIGHLGVACLGAWVIYDVILPYAFDSAPLPAWQPALFGFAVGGAGLLGDLAESMLKRDVGAKDSSRWLPGFGGVLDIIDAILLAAPVAWLCYAAGLVR